MKLYFTYNHQDFIHLHLTLPLITQRRIHALNDCGCPRTQATNILDSNIFLSPCL
jgi:hypothetical protein